MSAFEFPPGLEGKINQILIHHLVNIVEEKSEKSISSAIEWLCDFGKSEKAVLCRIDTQSQSEIVEIFNLGYPASWIDLYQSKSFVSVDPVMRHAIDNGGVFPWKKALLSSEGRKTEKFMEAAADYGLRGGTASGYRRDRAASTIVCSFAKNKDEEIGGFDYALQTLIPIFYANIGHGPLAKPRLSAKELEVLKWAGQGKTVWEISMIITSSTATVKFHLQNVYRKLGVSTRAQAVAAALKHGLICI